MNILDLNQTGGLPLSTQILDGMQNQYKITNNFSHLAGNLVIVTGCIVSGSNVTDGYVTINGELLFFKGSTISENVVIVQNAENPRGFEDGSAKPVIYERFATFGAGSPSYPWSQFRRPLTLLQLEDRLLKVEQAVPIGLVAIWGRPAEDIPPGWVEHTDMQGYVPVGHKPGDVNFGALNATIGTAQVTLTIDQIPEHDHSISPSVVAPGGSTKDLLSFSENVTRQFVSATGKRGGGQSHTNIQPSRIAQFIRFVGFN